MGAFTNVQLSAAIASYVSCIFSPVAIFTTASLALLEQTGASPQLTASGGRGTGGGGGGGWLVGSLSLSVQVEISES